MIVRTRGEVVIFKEQLRKQPVNVSDGIPSFK